MATYWEHENVQQNEKEEKKTVSFNLDTNEIILNTCVNTIITINNLWFFEFQHKFMHTHITQTVLYRIWCGQSPRCVCHHHHRDIPSLSVYGPKNIRSLVNRILEICLVFWYNFYTFRSSAFLLAHCLFPIIRIVTCVCVCMHLCVKRVYKWKKKFNGVFVKSNWKTISFLWQREKYIVYTYNILIIQLIVCLLSMAIFYYTKNKWMTGWMNEWMNENTNTHMYIYAQHVNDDRFVKSVEK